MLPNFNGLKSNTAESEPVLLSQISLLEVVKNLVGFCKTQPETNFSISFPGNFFVNVATVGCQNICLAPRNILLLIQEDFNVCCVDKVIT